MPTIEQIRAARALLDWSQSDLANHADLSQTGIARIENGTNQPNSRTLEKIENAFDRADIEFIGDNGVKKRTGEIKTLKGSEGFRELMDDVYETAKTIGGDIRLFNGIPKFFIQYLGEDFYKSHSARMNLIKDNYDFRIIIEEGDYNYIAGLFAEYRWFPKDLFRNKIFYAYGNKLAFLDFSDSNLIIRILDERYFADSFKILFDIAWDNIAICPPPKD